MFAVISSLAAAFFLALASFMLGQVVPILLLSLACACAWVSHSDLPQSLRQSSIYLALALYMIVFVLTLLAL